MFALLQVLPGEYTASGTEDAKVIKVDRSKKRLEEYASAYQYRYRAAVEDFEALDPDPDVSWSPEHHSLFDEMHDKYRVIGVLAKETTFRIVHVNVLRAAHDHWQCTRCQYWKHVSCFHADAAMPESRHVCRDCFADWLDEEEAERKREMH